jgi:hypothetical protein
MIFLGVQKFTFAVFTFFDASALGFILKEMPMLISSGNPKSQSISSICKLGK